MTPYKIYINWDTSYTLGVMSGSFTEITDDIFDFDIKISRKRSDKSIAIVRYFASGSFTFKGANFLLLKNKISLGIPELAMKIEQYSEVNNSYFEIWTGTVETRPNEIDDNRQIAKLTKFKTIDKYSDIEYSYTNTWTEDFEDYQSIGDGLQIFAGASKSFYSSKKMYTTEQPDSFQVLKWDENINIKYTNINSYKITPGYYDTSISDFVFFFGKYGTREIGLLVDSISNFQSQNTQTISFSLKKILDIYKYMFNLFWYIDYAVYLIGDVQSIQFKTPSQLIGLTSLDYTLESKDFASYSFLDTEYFVRETFQMSETNKHKDHFTQSYEYQLLAENDFTYSLSDVITDFRSFILSIDLKNIDIAVMTADIDASGTSGAINSAAGINDPIVSTNYICSLSYRMANYLNDYRQLNSAKFNGSIQSLNPNIARPSLRQEKFPIELDLLSDFDFTAKITTSIGNTFAEELILDLKTSTTFLICVK